MNKTAIINIRVSEDEKKAFLELYKRMGFNSLSALVMWLMRSALARKSSN